MSFDVIHAFDTFSIEKELVVHKQACVFIINIMSKNFKSVFIFCILFTVLHVPLLIQDVSHTHKWRQADTAAVAKNFYSESGNIFYPRIDLRGDKTGITGMEFPLYQYVSSLFYSVFDLNSDVPGKLVSLVSVLVLLFMLIRLAKVGNVDISSESITIVFFCMPFVFFYATAYMPELFALVLAVTGVYYLYQYRVSDVTRYLVLATFFLCIGSLSRPFLIFLCWPLLWCFIGDLKKKHVSFPLMISGLTILFVFSMWYFIWSPFLVENFELNYFYSGSSIQDNIVKILSLEFWKKLSKEISQMYLGWVWVPFFVYGFYRLLRQKSELIKMLFLTSIFGIFCIGLITGWHFSPHHYYLIFILPFLLYSASFALDIVLKKYPKAVLGVGVVLITLTSLSQINIYRVDKDFKIMQPKLAEMKSQIPEDDLVIVEDIGGYAYSLHSLRRKGWVINKETIYQYSHVKELVNKGAKWVIPIESNQSHYYEAEVWLHMLAKNEKSGE